MIKGNFYLKLLKQFCFSLLISCFIFLGSSFVNAGVTLPVGINSSDSVLDSNYDITFLKGGAFLSTFLGQGRPLFALRNNVLVWWAENGFPYFYLKSSNVPDFGLQQGFPDRFYVCDEITSLSSSMPGNCSLGEQWNYSSDNSIVTDTLQRFFKSIVIDDYVFYNFVDANYELYMQLCWSSQAVGNSLCFKVGKDNGNSSGGPLINSQNLTDMTFSKVSDSWIGKAPGVNGYLGNYTGVINGSDQGFLDFTLTGDYTYLSCTYGAIIDYFEKSGFSRNLCYGGLDNFDLYDPNVTYNPIPGQGKSLGQILANASSTWDSPVEWFNFWNGLRGGYPDMWSSYPAVYKTWFDIYYQNGGDMFLFDSVREYCIMKDLNLNYDTPYNGNLSTIVGKACQYIQNNDLGITDSSGNVIVGVNWNGVGNISGSKVSSPVGYIQDYFNKLKSSYPDRHDFGFGILPTYIITALLGLILFRFLSH